MRWIIMSTAIISIMTACSGTGKVSDTATTDDAWTTQRLLTASRDSAYSSMKERNRGRAKDLAQRGIEYAERCLMHAPENAGCLYWRSVNTGLYYKVRVIGYQRGIKQMIEDCNRVIAMDPKYDNGGAYRMLGQIYTQLPQTGARVDSITRNLPLAEECLKKAIKAAPDYPENYLAFAEALFAEDKIPEAIDALASAKDLSPHWKHDVSYKEWASTIQGLEKRFLKKK